MLHAQNGWRVLLLGPMQPLSKSVEHLEHARAGLQYGSPAIRRICCTVAIYTDTIWSSEAQCRAMQLGLLEFQGLEEKAAKNGTRCPSTAWHGCAFCSRWLRSSFDSQVDFRTSSRAKAVKRPKAVVRGSSAQFFCCSFQERCRGKPFAMVQCTECAPCPIQAELCRVQLARRPAPFHKISNSRPQHMRPVKVAPFTYYSLADRPGWLVVLGNLSWHRETDSKCCEPQLGGAAITLTIVGRMLDSRRNGRGASPHESLNSTTSSCVRSQPQVKAFTARLRAGTVSRGFGSVVALRVCGLERCSEVVQLVAAVETWEVKPVKLQVSSELVAVRSEPATTINVQDDQKGFEACQVPGLFPHSTARAGTLQVWMLF